MRAKRHCSDEELVAWMDGELSRRVSRHVGQHLESCWQCRLALNDFENTVLHLSRAHAAADTPDSGQAATALEDFDRWRGSLPQTPTGKQPLPSWRAMTL